jgi:hypothetical protein
MFSRRMNSPAIFYLHLHNRFREYTSFHIHASWIIDYRKSFYTNFEGIERVDSKNQIFD